VPGERTNKNLERELFCEKVSVCPFCPTMPWTSDTVCITTKRKSTASKAGKRGEIHEEKVGEEKLFYEKVFQR